MKRYTARSVLGFSLSRRFGAILAVAALGACSSSGGGSSSARESSSSGDDASAAASCWGTPTDCEDQDPGSCVNGCNLILGVYPMPNSCGGSPDPCNQLGLEDLCDQAGCQWGTPGVAVVDGGSGVAPTQSCQGTPSGCAGQGEGQCGSGCTWSSTCKAVNEAGVTCTYTAPNQCDEQPGCEELESCTGTEWPCSFEADETSCAAAPGCSWQ